MNKTIFVFCGVMLCNVISYSQERIPLYADSVPNSKFLMLQEVADTGKDGIVRISKVTKPTITMYAPPTGKANGTAVIICPGGGYGILAYNHEGINVAKVFNEWGVTAFVLKYRLPGDAIMIDKSIGPLQDAQRAIQLVRERAGEWKLDPRHIGIMGFSAGGHLASTAATHFEKSYISNPAATSLRPDFAILVYPVISFSNEMTHMGSRNNLLGPNPAAGQIKLFSNELQVTKKTPPTFLIHAKDDKGVPVENSFVFIKALEKAKVPHDSFFYEKGGHGFGLTNKTSDVNWMDKVKGWMSKNKWL